MTDSPFVSYAQNGEDVVLHRALGHVANGRYIDIGANDPTLDSVTRAFYNLGWRGITVEPVEEYAERQRAERPEDIVVQAAVTQHSGRTAVLHEVTGTGLSTLDDGLRLQHRQDGFTMRDVTVSTIRLDSVLADAGWHDSDIHFMSIDAEGAEGDVLRSLDLNVWRPWIILAEATRPRTAEPDYDSWEQVLTAAQYRFALFDGLSRFYVAAEHWDELHPLVSTPANALDHFVSYQTLVDTERIKVAEAALAHAQQQLVDLVTIAEANQTKAIDAAIRWRTMALGAWADSAVNESPVDSAELDFLRRQTHEMTREVNAMRRTLSWRVTRPLRVLRKASKVVGK